MEMHGDAAAFSDIKDALGVVVMVARCGEDGAMEVLVAQESADDEMEDDSMVAGEFAASASEVQVRQLEEMEARVSFWKMVTWQALIGQFGEWRIITLVIM
ncbi:hypothetical protein DEO72_LG10g1929 [Vigna unguiculata]|uniref:Uncharacterized protein n=1 Tax=Vigna unguiculata TaxID=3917 RepID=A0A4D6NBL6_VIGUN|nr:hypothetical protein DEO72_LG10g1929 [Vigna unguiculata]